MAFDDALNEVLDRIRAAGAPVAGMWNVHGPPAEEVRRLLVDWCGHAPDELVTWFSTINGAEVQRRS